ncbi:MAG: hypothetical protein HGB26_04625 [Desulfobulbaceae bacterium]|nr:hypothetical protein [Desulfobulbaceae bacterium]
MKKNSLAEALLREPKTDVADIGQASKPSFNSSYIAPARIGKKAVTVWFEPDVVKQLKLIGIEKGMTIQDMMRESLNDYFAKHRKAQIA